LKPQKKILITGAPGTGKTSIITALEKEGFYCFHEIIRTLTAAAKKATNKERIASNPLAFVNDPVAFNQALLQGRKDQYIRRYFFCHPGKTFISEIMND